VLVLGQYNSFLSLPLVYLSRTLLDARVQIGTMDDGARFHVVSQLIRETVEIAKSMLATSMVDKEKLQESTPSESSVHSLLQRDRVASAVQFLLLVVGSLRMFGLRR
jgi:hypothetical protein